MTPVATHDRGQVGNYRWVICALLFFCTTINYIDRNSLSVLKTTLQGALGWDDVDYGTITTAFTFAYAMFPSVIGIVIDRFGVKKALACALILWSLAAAAHGLVATVMGFVIVRFILGFAEAANFPASIKAVGMWFPQKERAFATGIFNSGTSIGVIVSGRVVWIAAHWGWQMSFVSIGLIGLVWLYFWQMYFTDPEEHPKRLGKAELDYIRSDQPVSEKAIKVPWTTLVRYREIWPFLIGKLITDPVWWFYLFWLPSYLDRERGQNPLNAGLWVAVIYTGSSVGSILGGWLSSTLMKRGWTVGKARMTTMALAAIFMPGSILAYYTESFVRVRGVHHARHRLPPGVVGQSVHQRHRPVSAEGLGFRRRSRRHRGRHRRHVHDACWRVSRCSGPANSRSCSCGRASCT